MNIVIIGGVAAGPKVAARIMRNDPKANVTVVEKGKFLSYAGCGLPYYVSGVVKTQEELMSTPVGVMRDPVFFQKVKNFTIKNFTEATKINRAEKTVDIKDLNTGEESSLSYDKLVICTGASPFTPPIDGADLDGVYHLHGIEDAEGIKARLAEKKALDTVIMGGGLIGLEMTEALAEHGCRVTVVEMLDHVLPIIDPEMATLVEKHMEAKGARVMTSTKVTAIKGEGKVSAVVTDKGEIPADMVIVSVGVRPNTALAKDAGLELGKRGGILTDATMLTSDEDIYAAGDCVEPIDLITGEPTFVPLGSTANKQGRVAANSVCGKNDAFPGVIGSSVCKVFDFTVARTGLTDKAAKAAGYDIVSVIAPGPDKPHFMPGAAPIFLKLTADKDSRRILGMQAVGPGDGDKRVNAAAVAITAGMTVDEFAQVDLCYAPPYSPAMDNALVVANVLRNKLDGQYKSAIAQEIKPWLDSGEAVLLDVRSPGEREQMLIEEALWIPLGALRSRTAELPKDKRIIPFCKISLRGYEAALILQDAGFEDVVVMDGGIITWPYKKTVK